MQTRLLKSKMALYGDTLKSLSEHLELTTRAMCYKVNGNSPFKANEIKSIKERYNLTDAEVTEIFLS